MYGPINGTFENSSFYYLSCYFLLHRFWALQILPPLTEISSSRFVRKGLQKAKCLVAVQFRVFFSRVVLSTNVFYIFFCHLNKEMIRNTWVYYVQLLGRSREGCGNKDQGKERFHYRWWILTHLMIPFCPLKTVVGAYPPLTWLVFYGPQSWSCHPS